MRKSRGSAAALTRRLYVLLVWPIGVGCSDDHDAARELASAADLDGSIDSGPVSGRDVDAAHSPGAPLRCAHWDGGYAPAPEPTFEAPGEGVSPEGACTLAGCISRANASGDLAGAMLETLRTMAAEACHNDVCERAPLSDLRSGFNWPDRYGVGGRFAPGVRVEVIGVGTAVPRVVISLVPARITDFHDGDRLRFTLQRADGQPVLRWEGAARYSVYVANGPGCGPTCRSIAVQLAYVEGC